jgi:hypothetical protein
MFLRLSISSYSHMWNEMLQLWGECRYEAVQYLVKIIFLQNLKLRMKYLSGLTMMSDWISNWSSSPQFKYTVLASALAKISSNVIKLSLNWLSKVCNSCKVFVYLHDMFLGLSKYNMFATICIARSDRYQEAWKRRAGIFGKSEGEDGLRKEVIDDGLLPYSVM